MKVSVLIPLYNKRKYIKRALSSVLSQTFGDFEIVVVDDGSTDDSVRIVESLKDTRIRLISQENAGASAARNTAIQAAKGEWIGFLDADDEWLAGKLAVQLEAINSHPDVVWSASGFICTNKDGKILANIEKFEDEWFEDKWFEDKGLLGDALVPLAHGRHFWTGTVMVKRDILINVRGFDTSLITGEDVDLWFRLAVKHPRMVYVSKSLAKYNVGLEDALTTSGVVVRDEESVCKLAHRVLDTKIDSCRAELLRLFAKQLLLVRLNVSLLRGKNDLAKRILRNINWIDLGFEGKMLRFKASIPSCIYTNLRRIASWLKSFFLKTV